MVEFAENKLRSQFFSTSIGDAHNLIIVFQRGSGILETKSAILYVYGKFFLLKLIFARLVCLREIKFGMFSVKHSGEK